MTLDVIQILDRWEKSDWQNSPKYGIFYKDKLLTLSKVRIYKTLGAAKVALAGALQSAGLFNQHSYHLAKLEAKGVVQELIKENIIQIKLL